MEVRGREESRTQRTSLLRPIRSVAGQTAGEGFYIHCNRQRAKGRVILDTRFTAYNKRVMPAGKAISGRTGQHNTQSVGQNIALKIKI